MTASFRTAESAYTSNVQIENFKQYGDCRGIAHAVNTVAHLYPDMEQSEQPDAQSPETPQSPRRNFVDPCAALRALGVKVGI